MYYIGIDLGGTKIATGLVSADGALVRKTSRRTDSFRGYGPVVRDMADTVSEVLAAEGLTADDVISIGIGTPGAVDPKRGVVMKASNLGFIMTPLGDEMKKYYNKPVFVNNDANCAAFAEAKVGAAKGRGDVVMFTLGTGIGGGIIIGGRIYEGYNGTAGEVGHFILVADGEPCPCGNRGCFERYASATALINQTRAAMLQNPGSAMWEMCGGNADNAGGRTAFDAMRAGDETAAAVVDRFVSYLAQGVASFFNILQPECVIIGGGLSNEGDNLLDPLREKTYSMIFGHAYHEVGKIVKAELGNDAGIIGAALLGLNMK